MPFEIVPRCEGFGASVKSDDRSSLLERDAGARLRSALDRFGVLVFPGLMADDVLHVALARAFGEIQDFGGNSIFRSTNVGKDGTFLKPGSEEERLLRLNWLWHSDGVYRERDIRAVLLRAEEFEDGCGDTEFADLASAFAALPSKLRRKIEPLSVEFSFEHMVLNEDVPPLSVDERRRLPRASHPLVQLLPDGRRSLRLSPPYMKRVAGWTSEDSLALFRQLAEFATQPDFIFRHSWGVGDLIAWNNRWTMHRVRAYDDQCMRRDMRGAVVLA
jgi:alpha-ketoglutarate-dependent taurine dioxygenase